MELKPLFDNPASMSNVVKRNILALCASTKAVNSVYTTRHDYYCMKTEICYTSFNALRGSQSS